ncbi:MAG: Ycf51 family protein [Cyanobacteria bacterium P01_H01_bin.15]
MSINLPTEIATYAQWCGWFTIALIVLLPIAFFAGWGWRFRLVGAVGFMIVLTGGLYTLDLGLFTRTQIPGAIRYALVYDNGANRTSITVPPTVTPSEAEATLKQAAADLYSRGRLGIGRNQLLIRLRTVIHPEEGVSIPLYLGDISRSLTLQEDPEMQITLYPEAFAQLPESPAIPGS